MMRKWFLAALTVALFLFSSVTRADFLVTIGSLDLNSGGSGTLDVMIASSDGVTPQALANAGYTFVITPLNNGNTLEFVTAQDQSYEHASNYVFPLSGNVYFNNSNGVVSSGTGTHDILTGGDNNYDSVIGLSNVLVTSPVLLIRLQITAAAGAQPQSGDQFSVSLSPPTDSAYNNTTFFQTAADADAAAGEAYSSTSGLVTIRSVPEPGSFALLALGSLASGWMTRRRTIRKHSA